MKSASSTKENHSADWAFNFRSSHFGAYDTDSDAEEGPAVPAGKESEEAKLAKDLDISERQETAVYKPNPFSIAKINAAARTVHNAQVDKPATQTEPAPFRDAPKSKALFTIVDGFKRQAQRAQSATKGKAPALKMAPRPTAQKPVHVSNQLKKPAFMTLGPHSGEKLGTSGRSLVLNSTAFLQATRPLESPDPQRIVASRPNISASLASEDFLTNSSNHSSPVSLKKTHIRPSGAHISHPQEASLLNSLSRRPQFTYNASQDQFLSQNYGALVSSKSAVLTSPSNGPAEETHSPLLYDARYDISEPAFRSGNIPDEDHGSSSNLILRERRDSRRGDSQGVVSNSRWFKVYLFKLTYGN